MKKASRPSLITGRQPVIEAIKTGQAIERIFLLKNSRGEAVKQLSELAQKRHIPVHAVPEEKLNRLHPARRSGRANDQGCIAIVSKVTYLDLQEVISQVVESGEVPLFVIIDSVTDVRNVGAIARSAVCCGAQSLIVPEKGVASLNEEAVKTSAGALEHLSVCRVRYLKKAIDTLHLNGFQVFASSSEGERYVYNCDWSGPSAIIMGSEDKGVEKALLKSADTVFKIPMAGTFDSFNVSVAAGIILYEAMKQRNSYASGKNRIPDQ